MQKSPNSKEQSTEKIYKRLAKSNPKGTQESRKYGLAQKSCRSHPHVIPKSSKSHPKSNAPGFQKATKQYPKSHLAVIHKSQEETSNIDTRVIQTNPQSNINLI